MTEECCTGASSVMILACSGGSNVGQLSNQAAVELTMEEVGKLYCLTGSGGLLPGFIQSAKDAEKMVVIDGCDIVCGKATLTKAGVPLGVHLVVTELGIGKNKDFNLKREEVDLVKEAVKRALAEASLSGL